MNWTPVEKYQVSGQISRGQYDICGNCGSIVPYNNRQQHTNFHLTFSNLKGQDMSKVLWCDPGNHAFKNGAPGSVSFQGSETQEGGSVVTTEVDACADHNPFRARPDHIVKELNREYPVEDERLPRL